MVGSPAESSSGGDVSRMDWGIGDSVIGGEPTPAAGSSEVGARNCGWSGRLRERGTSSATASARDSDND